MSGVKRKMYVKEEMSSTIPKKYGRRSRNVREELDDLRQCADLVDALRSYRTVDNRILCENFIRAPSRRTDPKYFDVVTHPIDLTRIQQKIKTEEYSTVEDLSADIRLLVNNNKAYYKEGSQEYKDACELWELFELQRKQMLGSISVTEMEERQKDKTLETKRDGVSVDLLEEIIVCTLELTDETGRLLSPPFRVLLSQEEFPTYYDRIKKPIDLKQIAIKIRSGEYHTWQQFDADFRLMCRNAKVFNELGSMISKDASMLLKNYMKRKAELCSSKHKPLTIKRINANKQVLDELLTQDATANSSEEYSEDSEEDEDSEHSSEPKWVLYWTIRNEPNPFDRETNLADPFLELPSKSWYPDYFDEISDPMSLFMINKKLKRGEYRTLEELLKDIVLVFENAKTYNVEGSDIYEAAAKLERLARSKARTLQKNIKVTEAEERISDKSTQSLTVTRSVWKKLQKMGGSISTQATTSGPKPKSFAVPSSNVENSEFKRRGSGRGYSGDMLAVFRSKLTVLWNTVYDHMDGKRRIATAFMFLPSRKDYPEYYDYIEKPIDLTTIKHKIETDQYTSTSDFMKDMDLLVHNAWDFNEPDSQIYRDATTLQSLVRNALSGIPDLPVCNPKHCKSKIGLVKPNLAPKKHKNYGSGGESSRCNDLDFEGDLSCGSNVSVSEAFLSHIHLPDNLRSSSPSCSTLTPTVSPMNATKTGRGISRKMFGSNSELEFDKIKLYELYNLIRNHRDERGRELSLPFLQLPSKFDYPDYYDVIRRPIDLTKIRNRITSNYYDSTDALISDFNLMFDNACRYNEPESMIYKDALSLQKLILLKKRDLCKDSASAINVQSEVQALLASILISVNNHQDSDGRCFSDSLADLPGMLRRKGIDSENIPFSIDEMKRNVDKGRYRRLDKFQDDLFFLFNVAMEHAHSDSQVFEDTVELWMYYLKMRDDLTRTTLLSPARWYTEKVLLTHVDNIRKRKLLEEAKDDEENKKSETLGPKADDDIVLDSTGQGGVIYRVNDYAYVAPASEETVSQRHIMRIERLYRDSDGQTFARGTWCYRPEETFHLATRKFCENEVFLTSYYDTVTVDRLIGKCHVMPVRQFMRQKPKGFDDSDIYVCECRYMGRQLHFKKLKHWPYHPEDEKVEYIKREKPLTMIKRVTSVFASRKTFETHPGAMVGTNDDESVDSISSLEDDRLKKLPVVLEKERVEVVCSDVPEVANKSMIFYEQMQYNDRWYRLGDFVYVYNPLKNRNAILRVDKLWKTVEGDGFFSGPYFARPREIKHEPARLFYKQEVFAVDQPDITIPLENVQGFCAVMSVKEYTKGRPTEIDESDVYVVESKVRGYEDGGKRCSLTGCKPSYYKNVTNDTNDCTIVSTNEQKASLKGDMDQLPSTVKTKTEDFHSNVPSTSKSIVEQPGAISKLGIVSASFSSISVDDDSSSGSNQAPGNIRNTPTSIDQEEPMNDAHAKKLKHSLKTYNLSSEVLEPEIYYFKTPITMEKPGQIRVYMCKWQTCDFQYDNPEELYDHVKTVHTSQIVVDGENQFVCLWTSCLKYRKDGKPFPSLPRLHRHIKEKHLATSAKSIYPNQRSKNYIPTYVPGSSASSVSSGTTTFVAVQQPANGTQQVHQTYTIQQAPLTYVTQAVVSTHQIVANGYVNGTAVAVAPTAYLAATPTVVHTSSHGYHPYHQVRQVTASTTQPIAVAAQNYTAVPLQTVSYTAPSTSQQSSPAITDPGRTVVQAPKPAQPVFVAPPNTVQIKRVMHSEVYLKYIESLSTSQQRTVSKYSRSLLANQRNTTPPQKISTTQWLKEAKDNGVRDEEVVKALWRLRDALLESTVNIAREMDCTGPL
ncbi:polybromodomain protein [Loa loa]|uniref:Polybromodomain protein n=1 Tax=Loa loa TaxID=7209 RepID=A0A1S0UH88_LOALO|nr:polybromodomain protein [Loa loa]EJD74959.1 polybromodomain protein [Loa loa]